MKIPVIHQTDLFRPYNDPDDHWDLATVYSLAYQEEINLKGIVIDFPPEKYKTSPDIMAINQLNYITKKPVSVSLGSQIPFKKWHEKKSTYDKSAALFILDILKKSKYPVFNFLVGSCRDVALAGKLEPSLFKEKCKRIYLNVGTGSNEVPKSLNMEYNVKLDIEAYSAMFDSPCPIYWLPCFQDYISSDDEFNVQEFGTYFSFKQEEILKQLSPQLQKYFNYSLIPNMEINWLQYLKQDVDKTLIKKLGNQERNMWNTACFFHAVGKTITLDGEIVPIEKDNNKSVFKFEPIQVSCDQKGITKWDFDKTSQNRFLFRIMDQKNYQNAMTKALKTTLMKLP